MSELWALAVAIVLVALLVALLRFTPAAPSQCPSVVPSSDGPQSKFGPEADKCNLTPDAPDLYHSGKKLLYIPAPADKTAVAVVAETPSDAPALQPEPRNPRFNPILHGENDGNNNVVLALGLRFKTQYFAIPLTQTSTSQEDWIDTTLAGWNGDQPYSVDRLTTGEFIERVNSALVSLIELASRVDDGTGPRAEVGQDLKDQMPASIRTHGLYSPFTENTPVFNTNNELAGCKVLIPPTPMASTGEGGDFEKLVGSKWSRVSRNKSLHYNPDILMEFIHDKMDDIENIEKQLFASSPTAQIRWLHQDMRDVQTVNPHHTPKVDNFAIPIIDNMQDELCFSKNDEPAQHCASLSSVGVKQKYNMNVEYGNSPPSDESACAVATENKCVRYRFPITMNAPVFIVNAGTDSDDNNDKFLSYRIQDNNANNNAYTAHQESYKKVYNLNWQMTTDSDPEYSIWYKIPEEERKGDNQVAATRIPEHCHCPPGTTFASDSHAAAEKRFLWRCVPRPPPGPDDEQDGVPKT